MAQTRGHSGTRRIKWFRPARGQFQIFYRHAADYLEYQPWRYLLIPHDEIAENHTLAGFAARFGG